MSRGASSGTGAMGIEMRFAGAASSSPPAGLIAPVAGHG